MPTLSLGGKVIATQTGSAEPEIPSTVSVTPTGAIVQQAQTINDKHYNADGAGASIYRSGSNKNTWAATGLIASLPNDLRANSKLMVMFSGTIGEETGSHWAQSTLTTVYQNGTNVSGTQISGLNSAQGLGHSGMNYNNAYHRGVHTWTVIFTPTGTGTVQRTVELYWKSISTGNFTIYLNAVHSSGYLFGGASILTIMEIAG